MEKRELTCIGCPMGCQITVELENGEIHSVKGNTCAIGDKYARGEVLHPERTVTSTVVVEGGSRSRIPVKTAGAVPKDRIFDCIREINAVRLKAPVRIGDIAVKNVAGTGVDVVATGNMERPG